MSGYLSRLIDRTLSRQELIRPRPAALFGQPVAEPEWQTHDSRPRAWEAQARETIPRDSHEPRERESAAPSRAATVAVREDRPARHAQPAGEIAPPVAALPVRSEESRVSSRLVQQVVGSPFAIAHPSKAPLWDAETLKGSWNAPVDPGQTNAIDAEGHDSRGAHTKRESAEPAAPIAPAAEHSVASRRQAVPVDESTLIERASAEHSEVSQPPRTHTAAAGRTHKTLLGKPPALLVEATDPGSSLPDTLATRGATSPRAGMRNSQNLRSSAESSTVHVTIGTLEVRANTAPAAPRAKPQSAKGPRLGLDEYLRRRREGGRE
jgi:hypothetical protein